MGHTLPLKLACRRLTRKRYDLMTLAHPISCDLVTVNPACVTPDTQFQ